MQDGEGKAARKSEEITSTPTRASSAEVTPRPMANERVQAQAKKAKKKGLEGYFGAGSRVPPPTLEGTPIDAVGKRRGGEETTSGRNKGEGKNSAVPRMDGSGTPTDAAGQQRGDGHKKGKVVRTPQRSGENCSPRDVGEKNQRGDGAASIRRPKKSLTKGSDDEHSRRSKKTRSDDDASSPDKSGEGKLANLESIKGLLRRKGTGTPSPKESTKKAGKTATFAEAVTKGATTKKKAPKITHKKCVVAFSVRVDRGKDTQAAFGKKIIAALSFLQTHIDKHAAFFAIDSTDSSRPPIKEKADLPGFQIILRRYFAIPSDRAFDSVNQEGGRAIRGSAVMGFSVDPQKCLEEAAGDLRHMGCAIFFKQCQEVNTVARQLLLGAPNTIEEEVIRNTFDDELKLVELRLVKESNAEYKYSERRLSKWIKYAVVREFPAGMPWEGAEEKRQKQGTNNARLAYVLHVHEPDYARMKTLLSFAKEWKVWHKHWGNTAFTVEIPNERSSQAEKTRYIQMVQTHGSVQLSMGAAMLEGLIDADTSFSLRLLPDAEGNARDATTTSIREIFNIMEIQGHKVWICISTGLNGMTTGYFSSVVQDISDHVAAFVACPGAQVYWWLRRRGCLTEDINRLIRHCFTLSQQQKVTASKYLKDLGHAVVDRADGDDIIQASSSVGIFDLTLGLSDKERRSLASCGHDAAAITFGEAKEGAIEAHNFSSALSLTSLRSAKRGGKGASKLPAQDLTLAQSVYSIGTSKVTNESEEKLDDEEESTEDSTEERLEVTFDGMDIVTGGNKQGDMLLSTASMEEESRGDNKEGSTSDVDPDEGSPSESNDSTWKGEEAKEVSRLTTKMKTAASLLHLDSEDERSDGSDFGEDCQSVRSGDLDLDSSDYESDAQEVSSGEFDAKYVKKYENPKTFLQVLWNTAGPSAGAMRICLEIIDEELQGQLLGLQAEFRDLPEELIQLMYQEAGDDPADAITFISRIHQEIGKYDDDEGEKSVSHVRNIQYDEIDPAPDIPMAVDGDAQEASKTHGTLPGAHQTSPAEGAVAEPATNAGGDKEGMQSMSVAEVG